MPAPQKVATVPIKEMNLDSQGRSPGNMVDLVRGRSYGITFAQWDGGNQERGAVKLVGGSWQTLRVE